ncbi:PREDICTED: gamma-glutamyl peptidase 5-like isoform X2 [Lupinus angustifolius]|uniref:gamma-glutamyl peptidase 5-like isoform X2 n=1 Tax=Lupinus angustifolius TaxID=3871 RepID=UPI00092E8422|nr:PREDICTED: gamma-glutamyl peptidase 5-like isoform X2 [Lupinus angustifolius]
MSNIRGKRFAVLLCAEDSEYVKKKYGGYSGVFMKMLAEEGEIWEVYKVASGEFPQDDDLSLYDGFVISGSCSDAHGNDKWIHDLITLLNKLQSMNKKTLGICFGHQIRELPPKAEVLGWSDKTGIEMFKYGDHMMGIQGHPEYSTDILFQIIDRLTQRDFIMEAVAVEAREKAALWDPDMEAWKRLCINFLKGYSDINGMGNEKFCKEVHDILKLN